MGYRKFADIAGEIDNERRARIDAIKEEARADAVAFNLSELRRHRELTQVELAERLKRAQATISAMETAEDNLLSTWRTVVESMGRMPRTRCSVRRRTHRHRHRSTQNSAL